MKVSVLHCSFHSSSISGTSWYSVWIITSKLSSYNAPYLLVCFQDVGGCNTSPVEGADSGDSSLVYMCSALSREDGTFVFPSLASGEYTVVRFLKAVPIS